MATPTCHALDFVTARSQARDSNMHDTEGDDVDSASTASTGNDMEVGVHPSPDASSEPVS